MQRLKKKWTLFYWRSGLEYFIKTNKKGCAYLQKATYKELVQTITEDDPYKMYSVGQSTGDPEGPMFQ